MDADEAVSAKLAALEMVTLDLERANERVSALERDNVGDARWCAAPADDADASPHGHVARSSAPVELAGDAAGPAPVYSHERSRRDAVRPYWTRQRGYGMRRDGRFLLPLPGGGEGKEGVPGSPHSLSDDAHRLTEQRKQFDRQLAQKEAEIVRALESAARLSQASASKQAAHATAVSELQARLSELVQPVRVRLGDGRAQLP